MKACTYRSLGIVMFSGLPAFTLAWFQHPGVSIHRLIVEQWVDIIAICIFVWRRHKISSYCRLNICRSFKITKNQFSFLHLCFESRSANKLLDGRVWEGGGQLCASHCSEKCVTFSWTDLFPFECLTVYTSYNFYRMLKLMNRLM